ncbi:MAG: MBL fold metallo-hydrolase [Cuniculiplasma sp.]
MEFVNSFTLIPGTMANCYDISFNGVRILMDAGTKGSGKKIIEYYETLKAKPQMVLITHYHPDHIGGLALIKEKYDPQVYVPDGEIEVVRGEKKLTPAGSLISKLLAGMMKSQPVRNVKKVSELHMDGLKIIRTGGHTPDSTSYFFMDLRAIFVGDAAIMGKDGVGVNKGFTLDYEKAMSSIEMLKNEGDATIYPGHGKPFQIKKEKDEIVREE